MTPNKDGIHVPKNGKSEASSASMTLGLVAVFLFFVASGVIVFWNTRTLFHDSQQVAETHEMAAALSAVLTSLQDAETGQRGFVITGNERYLAPYDAAVIRIDGELNHYAALIKDHPELDARMPEIRAHVKAKLNELAETVELRRSKGFEAAHAVVVTDRGKNDMDALRNMFTDLRHDGSELRRQREAEKDQAYQVALASGLATGVLGLLLTTAVGYLIRRNSNMRERQQWLQTGMVNLGQVIAGDQRVEQLSSAVLGFFTDYFGATVGAFYVKDGPGFRRAAAHGVPEESGTPGFFRETDGLLGQAAREKKILRIDDVPDDLLTLGSAFTRGKPRSVLIAPACTDHMAIAVCELGFLQPLDALALELLDRASESIAVAVKSANYRARLQDLLDETQRQSEELQTQSEELRVSNEELAEQSNALKEQQVQLEQQQAELEQTNAQLEEKSQLLEAQKADLVRSKLTLESQARIVEQTSQYKSDFLANMSHELRTPLNSTLILAKLLADNKEGNLSEEQRKYARTIQSAGNDLLALINDVLDLSKIEAGRMDLRPKRIELPGLMDNLRNIFEPVARQKRLEFKVSLQPGAPETIETDPQRLEQILKNLLSNALKFTEQGSVTLEIREDRPGTVAFAVHDTGIGIEKSQQGAIFEPFCQADSTTSRKFGGTGLGLSISRELGRLLGGDIRLASEVGRGSTFTLVVPVSAAASPFITSFAETSAPAPQKTAVPGVIADDRAQISAASRTVLIVEDDAEFARILADIAHEQGFQCLIASTAAEALTLTQQHQPRAVLLDVALPDNSGLFVLEKLKRDARTRHIPVHVISGTDYSEKALSMGAVGYQLKPVQRERLVEAFQNLESRFTHSVRRVLIVEDDPVQLDALRSLLSSRDVEVLGAGNASKCLEMLKGGTFDCMVLDLSLPDASGFSLLETLSEDDQYAFPPVIVYTGRDLSADEEQRLLRYSKSIIIKGAKSPERLLDEVTLFLHQVVSDLPPEQQQMLDKAHSRDTAMEGRRVLMAEDDVRNVFALTSVLEPLGLRLEIARNGREAIQALENSLTDSSKRIDLVLMDIMMPEMDGLTAMREIRKRPEWKVLPIIALTAKAMRNDQERCLEAGANDYLAKPLDVDKLLSLIRVWMPR